MPKTLTITPAPFKSSRLAIPPSPFSPRLPNSPPPASSQAPRQSNPKVSLALLARPPSEPLNWLWQCHVCNRVYKLSVTRKCLDDGHLFCAGTTTVKRSKRGGGKKIVKHRACASEFDYSGWKAWGEWRRNITAQVAAAEALMKENARITSGLPLRAKASEVSWLRAGLGPRLGANARKDCWNSCDFPSECRWGKQFGMQVSSRPTVAVPSSTPVSLPVEMEEDKDIKTAAKTSFDDILVGTTTSTPELETTTEEPNTTTPTSPEEEKKPTFDDLLESVKRRRRRSDGAAPSPLGSNPPSPTFNGEESTTTSQTLHKTLDDFEIDIRKSLERAGGLFGSMVSGLKGSGTSSSSKGSTDASAMPLGLKVTKKTTGAKEKNAGSGT